ncbi:MAG: hypothetical protein P4L84_26480 [Isosphaeraceae bacterium]|nr:hypothetical protein [Isosphaeraceae bacterium]
MSRFDDPLSTGGSVPEWASFLKPSEFLALLDLVRAEFARHGLQATLDAQEGKVRLLGDANGMRFMGLGNLSQVCHQCAFHEWPGIVSQHFDRMMHALDGKEALHDRLSSDFAAARPLLKVRLYPADVAEHGLYTYRAAMNDVIAALVLDLPETVDSVHEDQIAAWGRPVDELFAIGLENVRTGDPVQPQTYELGAGGSIQVLGDNSFFTATHALMLSHYVQPPPERGALVAVPHRHAVIYHPIVDQTVLVAINTMLPMARGMFQEGPGSVSPHLYWWRDGHFTLLPAEVEGNTLEFRPPEDFVAMLERVMA